MSQHSFLETALEAARAGEEIIRHYYQHHVDVRLKADRTPVTVADVETEQTIRKILENAFPEHGFYGEETGKGAADAEYLWLVDPIDGTKNFIRQIPLFSTQIALMKGEAFILGVSNAPLCQELAYATVGGGAFLNDQPLRVSTIDDPSEASLSFGNIKTLLDDQHWQNMAGLIQRFDRTRGYGDFYHYHLLAAGKLDVVIESDISILDVAAVSVIIQEAGGQVTDLVGEPLKLDSTGILASNGQLHKSVLAALT